MHQFIKSFLREAPGVWACIAPVTWVGPPRVQVTAGTRFTRGNMFMGVDLAQLLDEQYEKERR